MAPPPKPDGTRRRRNGESKFTHVVADAQREIPPLPTPPKRRTWDLAIRKSWATIWRSPMAQLFEPADVDALVRMMQLKQDLIDFYAGKPWEADVKRSKVDQSIVKIIVVMTVPTATLKAIQDLEDRFGLSPKARQLARVSIDVTPSEVPASPPQHGTVRRLRAVDAVAGG